MTDFEAKANKIVDEFVRRRPDFDLRGAISAALRAERAEALEEAAKVADKAQHWHFAISEPDAVKAARMIGLDIRSLATEPRKDGA